MRRFQPVLAAGLLQVGQRCDAELLVDLRDLLRREAWDVQELQQARRHVGPHGLQPGRRAVLVQRADHLSERSADTRDLAQATLRDNIASGTVSVRRFSAARA